MNSQMSCMCMTCQNLVLGVNESPFMTWGEIESTPLRLEGSETPYVDRTPGPAFKVFHVRSQHVIPLWGEELRRERQVGN